MAYVLAVAATRFNDQIGIEGDQLGSLLFGSITGFFNMLVNFLGVPWEITMRAVLGVAVSIVVLVAESNDPNQLHHNTLTVLYSSQLTR